MNTKTAFLKRQDVAYPTQANPRRLYGVKLFKDKDLDDLQDEVNAYLLNLPDVAKQNGWLVHVVETEMLLEKKNFVFKLLLYGTGNLDTNPVNPFPP